MVRAFKHDQWAPLSHASAVGDGTERPPGARSWMDDDDARRIAVYERLAAYLDNVSRNYLPDYLWEKAAPPPGASKLLAPPAPAEKYREYGDPALLVLQARSFVLGDEQAAVIPDAQPLPDDAEAADVELQKRAEIFADWLDEWIEREQLWLRLLEGEELTIGLSDGVYEITWDAGDGVPRLEVHDPGFYFPVLTGPSAPKSGRYPNRVHLAWEEIDQETGTHWLYRKTYSREELPDGETRRYEYQDPDEAASRWTVYYTSGRWDLSKIKGTGNVYDLSDEAAIFDLDPDGPDGLAKRKDMFLDFVPVVHVPNDAAGRRHFGRSLLLRVAQILDELAGTDTDLSANSADLGSPPVVTTGVTGQLGTGPGAQWNLGGGDAKLLDTSKALDAQIKFVEHLLHRLSRNTRLAQTLLGDVQPNEVPSGYAFELGNAPTTNLIREMRMVRADKVPLIPRFAMRMAQQFKPSDREPPALPAGPTPRVDIRFGAFLPADKNGTLERVAKGLKDHAISTLTAVHELIEAGWSIDDATAEVERINSENFDAAVKLLEALGSEDLVAEFLGRDLPGTAPAGDAGDAGDAGAGDAGA